MSVPIVKFKASPEAEYLLELMIPVSGIKTNPILIKHSMYFNSQDDGEFFLSLLEQKGIGIKTLLGWFKRYTVPELKSAILENRLGKRAANLTIPSSEIEQFCSEYGIDSRHASDLSHIPIKRAIEIVLQRHAEAPAL